LRVAAISLPRFRSPRGGVCVPRTRFRSGASGICAKFFILRNFSCADLQGTPTRARRKSSANTACIVSAEFLFFAVTFPQPFALQSVTELT
jgi:hypothetical protein